MNCRSLSGLRLPMLLAALLCLQCVAAAAADRIRYDIPSQSLASALTQFGVQSKRQVVFDPDTVPARTAPLLKGEYTPLEALDILIQRSGLTYGVDGKNTIIIRRASAATAGAVMPGSMLMVAAGGDAQHVESPAAANVQAQEDVLEVISTKIDGLNKKSIFESTEESALPYNVIDREEIARMGATSIEELFRNVPELSSYGTNSQTQVGNTLVQGGNFYSGETLNLRNFGSQQTVVLVNGRRLGNSTTLAGPDISRIPIGSIERIEIMPAAAAAIYGGGAAGGAVNIILRREYEARELSTYIGTSTNGGGEELRMTYIDGRSFFDQRTRLTTTLDFSKRKPVYLGQRDYLDRMLERFGPTTPYMVLGRSAFESVALRATAAPIGTVVSNSPTLGLGIPGNPTARWAAIPAGITGPQSATLTRNSFTSTAGTYRQGSRYERSLLYRPVENYSLGVQLEHALLPDDRLAFYAEATVSYQQQEYSSPAYQNWSLPADHPYNPFQGVPIFVFLDSLDVPDATDLQERRDLRLTLGVKGKIGSRWDWMVDLSAQEGLADSVSSSPGNYIQYFSDVTVAPVNPAPLAARWAAYNPFQDHTMYPTTRPELWEFVRYAEFRNKNAEGAFRAVGTPIDLPAGAVQISPVADVRVDHSRSWQFQETSPEAMAMLGLTPSSDIVFNNSSTTYGGALEIAIPVFSPKWRPLPVHSLDINLSRRYDDSNRAKRVASDTIAARLAIVRDLSFRASLTDGFVLNRNETATFTTRTDFRTNIQDPRRGNVSTSTLVPTYLTGDNPDLRTEFIRSRNYGMMLQPRFIPGLLLNVNYFYNERLDTPASLSLSDLLNFPGDFPGRLVRAPLEANAPASYTAGAIQYIDLRRINLTRVEQRGVDYRITYSIPVPAEYGSLDWMINATNYRTFTRQARPSSAVVEQVNAQNQPLSWRGSSNIFWKRDRVLAGVTANYFNSYFASTTAPSPSLPTATGIDGPKIKRQLTFDLQLGYSTPEGSIAGRSWYSWLNATDVRVGLLNVLDTMPPLYSDNTGFYSRYGDPRQRYGYVQIKKNF